METVDKITQESSGYDRGVYDMHLAVKKITEALEDTGSSRYGSIVSAFGTDSITKIMTDFNPEQIIRLTVECERLKPGDEIQWDGGAVSVVLEVQAAGFASMDDSGNVCAYLYRDTKKHYRRTGVNYPQIAEVRAALKKKADSVRADMVCEEKI